MPAGGDGGSPGSAICPANQVLVGFNIWVDTRVYRVETLCQTVEAWKMSDSTANIGPAIGNAHSTAFVVKCSTGGAIFMISGMIGLDADHLVHSVHPKCRKL
ncbi:hypothetical protein BE08_07700 [Sorangium cellulosum]|uniref:Uncharacterized protein n=1 Tax=Sorangium cellulosum TaxID=56 RepID=A0A150PJQ7_SORCE|nr:hypothetical protein BE08_07700 [Sorangium cellulosum]